MGAYRFLEEVALADCAMEIEGRDLDDLFETAAQALARLMVDPATVALTVERTVTLEAAPLDLLLYGLLSEVVFPQGPRRGARPPPGRASRRSDRPGPHRAGRRPQGRDLPPVRAGAGGRRLAGPRG